MTTISDKDRYRLRGKLIRAKRHLNTPSGNAQWTLQIRLNGGPVWGMRTRPDTQCAGLIAHHHVGEYVLVTVDNREIIGYEVTDHDSEPKYTIEDWL